MADRITVDLAELQRVARDVVAETPAPRVAEVLVERLRTMHAEAPTSIPDPSPEALARARARVRRWGLG